jgi:nitrogen regulatory protein PII
MSFEIGYLAALIDGEGTLTIAKNIFHYESEYRKRGYTTYRPMLAIANTSQELLEVARDMIGAGKVYPPAGKKRKASHKGTYRYILYTYEYLLPLLIEIKDYLIVKKRQCELLIEFIESRLQKGNKGVGVGYSEREIEIYEEVKRLNRKGL